jgi:formyl-CoA transferase/CoA:oxalate CoA-transferase
MTYHAVAYLATGELPPRMGSRHPSVAPYGAFPTRDGYLVVAVALDSSWKRFCQALERPDLIEDPRFAKNPDRIRNRAEMEALLTEILAARGAAEWGEIMDRHGVPCSPINSLDTVLALPQVLQQELVIDLPREDIPDLRMPGIAIKLSDTPGTARLAPPRHGEHTDEVLSALGYDAAKIAELRASGVV